MPEAAADLDGELAPHERHVRTPGRFPPIAAVAGKAHLAQHAAHEHLRLRVAPLVALHRFVSGRRHNPEIVAVRLR